MRSAPPPELKATHLVLPSPAGIATTTPRTTHQHSGQHHAITSGGHTSISTGKSLLASAEQAIRLLAYKAGVKLISATSGIEFKAVEASIHLLAKLKITATAERVHIEAEEEVVINGGGSATQWRAAGITDSTAGTWVAHAASHGMPGAREMGLNTQGLPAVDAYDEKIAFLNPSGKPIAQAPYVMAGAAQEFQGSTRQDGTTPRVHTPKPEALKFALSWAGLGVNAAASNNSAQFFTQSSKSREA